MREDILWKRRQDKSDEKESSVAKIASWKHFCDGAGGKGRGLAQNAWGAMVKRLDTRSQGNDVVPCVIQAEYVGGRVEERRWI